MYKYVLITSFSWLMFLLSFFSEASSVYANETLSKNEHIQAPKTSIKKLDSCTVRCHVNYMAYENKYDVTQRAEIFRHKTHSFEQDLDCTSCHDNSEVNTKNHGKLTIKKENCLKCHHVELKGHECKRCHNDIDENPMKYKEEVFVHGFTVESDVDCGLCHVNDPNASLLNEEINCVKCHHTTPDLGCVKCHEKDLNKYHHTGSKMKDRLSWTVPFRHAQHSEQSVSCKKCHIISHENNAGIVGYNLNCSKCHHVSEGKTGCVECHKGPSDFLKGKPGIDTVAPLPDMMSRAVKCEDCHRYNDEKLKFMGVEENCIKCHNGDYGKLYNAWTKTIQDRLNEFNHRIQNLVEGGNTALLSGPDVDGEKNKEAGMQSDRNSFIDQIGPIIDIITKYGIHNFQLTKNLLDSFDEKIR